MGQYPTPYTPPPHNLGYAGYPGPPDLLAPARRASVMLIVVGALMALFAGCVGMSMMALTRDQMQQMINANPYAKAQPLPPGVSLVDFVRNFYVGVAIGGLSLGPVLVVLGILVRRANRVAMVLTVTLCGSLVVFELFAGVFGCAGNLPMASGSCAGLLPALLLAVAAGWLVQMLNALPKLEAARQQWQAYYTGLQQQQQQAYGQGPTGYGNPPMHPGGYAPPPYGAPPVGGGQGTYGYGIPQAPAPNTNLPPARHPPLPPDQQKPPEQS